MIENMKCYQDIVERKFEEIRFIITKIFNNEYHKIERLLEEKVDYVIDDDMDICINAVNNEITALYLNDN
jgi:hypothetical protein